MSMKKWQKLASEKAEVEQQNDKILAVIKNTKINKGFGQLSGEDLFKPITSRLDKLQIGDSNSKEEVPDYGMDEFDLNNPFDGDFNPDAETPPPTPTPPPSPSPSPTPSPTPTSTPTSSPPLSPSSTPLPPLAEEEEMELMELMEEEQPSTSGVKPQPSKWGPPQELVIMGSESVDLQTLNSILTKNKNNPNYVVKSKKSKFYKKTLPEIKKARDEILERRKGNKQPRAVLPKGVEELDRPGEWGLPHQEGSGSVDPNALVERLHISLASIQAGNTSLKLKKQVQQMLGLLVKLKEITQKEAHKILGSII